MRISTKGHHALCAMVDLALHGEQGWVTRDEMAERLGISPLYLSQILRRLNKARLITATKGPYGGYQLTRAPAEIGAGEIVRAAEESLVLVPCLEGPSVCRRVTDCAAHQLWQKLSDAVNATLDSVTLADLRDDALRLRGQAGGPGC